MLNEKDQGKTLTIDYNNSLVELSKESFTLPKTKDASENFTIKTKDNQKFSLTPKIDSKSFTKRDISATKDIPVPTANQVVIEEINATVSLVGNMPIYSYPTLEIFNDTFYLFNRKLNKYYSSDDGSTWKDEGQVHADYKGGTFTPNAALSTVYKNKLYLIKMGDVFQAGIPNSGNTLTFQKISTGKISASLQIDLVVYQNKITLFFDADSKIKTTTDGINWDTLFTITNDAFKVTWISPIVFENKIWSFGDNSTKIVLSFNGKKIVNEGNFPKVMGTVGTNEFAHGFLAFGGEDGSSQRNSDVYYSPYGKTWTKVKTYAKLGVPIQNASVLKSKDEIWAYSSGKMYKITFDPTK